MIVTLSDNANCKNVQTTLQGLGLWTRPLRGQVDSAITLLVERHSTHVPIERIVRVAGVREVFTAESPHPLVDKQANRPVAVGRWAIGTEQPLLMAGPCSIESESQALAAAAIAAGCGAALLRGGAFKPRSSPYAFSGHGRPALRWMRKAADRHGLGVVTEVMSEHEVLHVAAHADVLQIGSRNMQNFALLEAVGRARRPVLLKRGMAATVEDWLMSGEHLLAAGAAGVVFCERGIQSFDDNTRNLLDLGAVALLRHVLKQPVIVDPSHAVGRRDLIVPLCRAAVAAGAHGLLVEVHPNANDARSDGPQALDESALAIIGKQLRS